MLINKISKLSGIIKSFFNPVEKKKHRIILEEINSFGFQAVSDLKLKELSQRLIKQARTGFSADILLPQAFALVREVSRRVVGMRPFDVQVTAAIYLHWGRIVEMQTGEGKTLTAVMPAYLNALAGNGVHILTFNDYLSQRDAEWMGPIYEFLGLTVGYVNQGMSIKKRQAAYDSDITYLTAKEAGFDYLRDFLCIEKEKLVHRPFHYALVDEADSILIDEARIPLVIAGEMSRENESLHFFAELVRELQAEKDYIIDQHGKNIYLTDQGLCNVEKILGCGNLYKPQNLKILTMINSALYAKMLLKREEDYIVRNGKVEIIDEFTGRIADKRQWPDNLQAAIEAKEGLAGSSKGVVMGSLTLQHFLSLYPKLAGMTGTASTAEREFKEIYKMEVEVIPTNKPCLRKDHPDLIFTDQEAKQKALVLEIERVHQTGQPILIGTCSVEESELLTEQLRKEGLTCRLLNARNDHEEAKIIAQAGELFAVTVSTNMAGRGVDIKLGGEYEEKRDQVVALGGLYVIGTNLHESRRIDNQLRGRAGRQGDPGESRFFISLEDNLFKQVDLIELIPSGNIPEKQAEPLDDPVIRREILRGQRIIEGYNADTRAQLLKYSYIMEQQRRIIHTWRQGVLKDEIIPELLVKKAPNRYTALCKKYGQEIIRRIEKQITLYYLNKCWADYLEHMAYQREGIHLVVIGKKNPLDEFNRIAIAAFDQMLLSIDKEIIRKFNTVQVTKKGIESEKENLLGPSATWTYLINDDPNQFSNLRAFFKAMANSIGGVFKSGGSE